MNFSLAHIQLRRYHVPRAWLTASNNLLVIFEEVGGNPFEIAVKSRYTSIICSQISESHYPPVARWSGSNSSYIDNIKPELQLKCEDEYIISSIKFASYGTPQGTCQKFSKGKCHAPDSLSVVLKVFLHSGWFTRTHPYIFTSQ